MCPRRQLCHYSRAEPHSQLVSLGLCGVCPSCRLIQLNFSSRPRDQEQWVSLWRNMRSAFRPHPNVLGHPNPKVRALCLTDTAEAAAAAAERWAEVEKDWCVTELQL
eukprot:SAG11_NODE_1454_length_4879_cov_4.858577_4_plen_107_part_00